jgi:opacity protein-like surface antigen
MRNRSTRVFCRLVALGILGFLALAPAAQAQLQVGGGLAFGTEIEKLGLQITGNLPVAQEGKIRAAPDLIFYLKDDFGTGDLRWWEVNLNGNYLFMEGEEYNVYALAGINIANVNFDFDVNIPGVPGVGFDQSSTELGLNIGGGIEYGVPFGNLYGEAKYILSDFDQLVISAGVRIPFGGSGR